MSHSDISFHGKLHNSPLVNSQSCSEMVNALHVPAVVEQHCITVSPFAKLEEVVFINCTDILSATLAQFDLYV